MNPADIDAKHWLAVYYLFSGDNVTARKLEKENIAKNVRFFPARITLGELARQEGDWETAIREYGQVLEYDPQSVQILERLMRTHMDRVDLVQARQTLNQFRPEDRNNFRLRATESLLLALEGKREQAILSMDRGVIQYLEVNPLFTLTGAEFYALIEDSSQALEWLERAVRNGDDRAEWFARNPALTNIRQEERFQKILSSLAVRQPMVRESP